MARWLSKQLIWLADSKQVQGLTGLTRTRSSREHSYRLHTVCWSVWFRAGRQVGDCLAQVPYIPSLLHPYVAMPSCTHQPFTSHILSVLHMARWLLHSQPWSWRVALLIQADAEDTQPPLPQPQHYGTVTP
jgi:hypothetical protein